MQGINSHPYIPLDHHVDIQGFHDLHEEICLGIAQSQILAGIYGPGVVERDKYLDLLTANNRAMNGDKTLKTQLESMNMNQRNIFYKLYFGVYNPSTVVYLRELSSRMGYLNKDRASETKTSPNQKFFPKTMSWIQGLPFAEIGRILFFIHDHDCKLLTHRDGYEYQPHRNEFMWFCPVSRKLFIYDEYTRAKHYIESTGAFFNDLDMHGGDPSPHMTYSLRIDGKFTPEFRIQLGINKLKHY